MKINYLKLGELFCGAGGLSLGAVQAESKGIPKTLKIKPTDKPAYTITASGGGGTHGYHHEEIRPLTNRERARLQSFPDDFEFVGNYSQVRRQIGMAVPPLLSKIIFTALLNTLNGVEYEYIEENFKQRYVNTLFDITKC